MRSPPSTKTLSRPQKFALALGIFLVATDVAINVSDRVPPRRNLAVAQVEESGLSDIAMAGLSELSKPEIAPIVAATKSFARPTRSDLSRDEKELCQIKHQSAIPLGTSVRMQSVERGEGGRRFWIKSSLCPDELYSIIELDGNGRVEKEINCQSTNLTELTLNSGLQFKVEEASSSATKRPMAISGAGRFLVQCSDTGLTLTRDGRFTLVNGSLVNSEGCTAWTRKDGGRAVSMAEGETLDTKGCSTSTRECLEILDVDPRDTYAFNFKTSKSLSVLDERGLRTMNDAFIFQNSLEDLDSPSRSLTGLEDWEQLPMIKLPSKCP